MTLVIDRGEDETAVAPISQEEIQSILEAVLADEGVERTCYVSVTIATDDGTPCIENENSSVFAYMVTEGCGPNHQFTVAVNEFQNGCHRQLHAHQMPPYSVEYYYIPGYVGIHEDR